MKRRLLPLLAVFVTAGAMACNESLNGGAACPSLCPSQNVPILDTIIDPLLVFDSVFVGYPDRGLESEMLLATRGDTIQTVAIVRFDTLTTFYTPLNDSSHTITSVDSAQVRIVLNLAQSKLPDSVRFEVYDVDDTTANDSSSAAVLAKFRTDRKIGQLTVPRGGVNDTTFIPLSDSAILSKITNHTHLRLGFRVGGTGPVSFRMETIESGNAAQLWYRGTPDTTIATIKLGLFSATPTADPEVQSALTDFGLVVKNSLPQFPHTMSVGGMPGARAYLRFDVPVFIVDSTTVVRATLQLTQRPMAFGDASDTMTVHAHVALSGPAVTDLRRAANIITGAGLLVIDSILVTPRDTGVKSINLFPLLRAWGTQAALVNPPPHAVVLRTASESVLPLEALFFDASAPKGLRPTLHISYIPKVQFGIP
jgi:hypothetical protein